MSVQDLDGEIWKHINGFLGLYMISNKGRLKKIPHEVKSSNQYGNFTIEKPEKLIHGWVNSDGYVRHKIKAIDNTFKQIFEHMLVANAFIENSDDTLEINHKNGNKKCNEVSNLEWVTHKGNMEHAYKNNLISPKRNCDIDVETCKNIKRDLIKDIPVHEISNKYNYSKRKINYIKRGDTYTHDIYKVSGFIPSKNRRPLNSKLIERDVFEIRNLLKETNLTNTVIAKMYDIDPRRISEIKNYQKYKNVII